MSDFHKGKTNAAGHCLSYGARRSATPPSSQSNAPALRGSTLRYPAFVAKQCACFAPRFSPLGPTNKKPTHLRVGFPFARSTGLEPVASTVTGWRDNQLHQDPGRIVQMHYEITISVLVCQPWSEKKLVRELLCWSIIRKAHSTEHRRGITETDSAFLCRYARRISELSGSGLHHLR